MKGLNGQKAPLYNAHILHNMDEETVFITEGKKDADTVSNMDGIPATTIPNGAGFTQWINLRARGIGIEFRSVVRRLKKDGTHEERSRGFFICCLTDIS